MPRPPLRRRKPNQATPKRQPGNISSSAAKAQLERTLASKPVGQRLSDSDDSDRLVTKGPGRRRGRDVAKQEIYMSGAVGQGDVPGSSPSRSQRKKSMTRTTKSIIDSRLSLRDLTKGDATGTATRPSDVEKPGLALGMRSAVRNGVVAPSSAVRAPTMMNIRSQPTPGRETSILGGIKPRKRQPSILRVADDSTLELTEGDISLPDFESTPLNTSKSKTTSSTPSTSLLQSSTSRKRKLVTPQSTFPPSGASQQLAKTAQEPSLPPMPISALRTSGRKQRQSAVEDDILAPPASSSSGGSPVKAKVLSTTRTKNPPKAPAVMSTEQLQALMPTKRRKLTKRQVRAVGEFEIKEDSDGDSKLEIGREADDDSSFLPPRRNTKARQRDKLSKRRTTNAKPTAGVAGKGRAQGRRAGKSSTRLTTPLSTSGCNGETKSSSQQAPLRSSTAATTTTTKATARNRISAEKKSNPKTLSSAGGFHPLNTTTPTRSGLAENKENRDDDFVGSKDPVDMSSAATEAAEGNQFSDSTAARKGAEAAIATVVQKRSKWDDIDAWDMEFEDVEVMTGGSSSPMRR